MSFRFNGKGTAGDDYVFTFGTEIVTGGKGNDTIIGSFDMGHNSFSFTKGDGQDQVIGYQPGVDDITLHGYSPKEVTMEHHVSDFGIDYVEINAGGFAGQGVNADHYTLWGIASTSDVKIVIA